MLIFLCCSDMSGHLTSTERHLHKKHLHLFVSNEWRKDIFHLFSWLPFFHLSHFQLDSDFCHVRPTSVTCSSLSSPAKVPYVCQNVYVVCFFRPDLFPCLLSNEPRSPRGSEPKPHAIYTDRTAGALPAKAARDEGGRGMGREIIMETSG